MSFCEVNLLKATYITGNTLGKTTEPSAKYWYNTRVSFSSVVYLTNVAKTVNTKACVDKSGITSGSSRTFDSFDTDDLEPRSCMERKREIFVLILAELHWELNRFAKIRGSLKFFFRSNIGQ